MVCIIKNAHYQGYFSDHPVLERSIPICLGMSSYEYMGAVNVLDSINYTDTRYSYEQHLIPSYLIQTEH